MGRKELWRHYYFNRATTTTSKQREAAFSMFSRQQLLSMLPLETSRQSLKFNQKTNYRQQKVQLCRGKKGFLVLVIIKRGKDNGLLPKSPYSSSAKLFYENEWKSEGYHDITPTQLAFTSVSKIPNTRIMLMAIQYIPLLQLILTIDLHLLGLKYPKIPKIPKFHEPQENQVPCDSLIESNAPLE